MTTEGMADTTYHCVHISLHELTKVVNWVEDVLVTMGCDNIIIIQIEDSGN